MTSEVSFNLPDNSVLKRMDRFTTDKVGIILDRHAPVKASSLTLDPEGEYVRIKDLIVLLRMGALIEINKEISERLQDGVAHSMLMKRLDSLGYEDFDQVIKVLTDNRNSVLSEKEFEIWASGYNDMGNICYAYKVGEAKGYSFYDACINYHKAQDKNTVKDWRFDGLNIFIWGMSLHPTKEEAEVLLGKDPTEKN